MKNKKLAAILCGIFLCLGVSYFASKPEVRAQWSGNVYIDEARLYKVVSIMDGDTFVADVNGKEITVRMLGIDTPETVDPRKPVQCYGPEASNETKKLLGSRSVRLVANKNRESKDKYGRYLMYIYRDDGLFVNEELLNGGFAREFTFGKPYSFQAEFRQIEKSSKDTSTGLWSACK